MYLQLTYLEPYHVQILPTPIFLLIFREFSRVRSLAKAEAPSRAADIARMSSASEEAFEGLLT